jgi:hypothetical protein
MNGPPAVVVAFCSRRRQCRRQSSLVAAAPPLSHGQARHDEWSRRLRGRISCLPLQRSIFERRGRHPAKGKERGFAVSIVGRGSGHGRTRSYGAGRTLTRRRDVERLFRRTTAQKRLVSSAIWHVRSRGLSVPTLLNNRTASFSLLHRCQT